MQQFAAPQQLELGFAAATRAPEQTGRRSGVAPARAQWWFHRIRQVLAQAAARPAPGRPEQVYLTLPARSGAGWSGREPDYRLASVWQS